MITFQLPNGKIAELSVKGLSLVLKTPKRIYVVESSSKEDKEQYKSKVTHICVTESETFDVSTYHSEYDMYREFISILSKLERDCSPCNSRALVKPDPDKLDW